MGYFKEIIVSYFVALERNLSVRSRREDLIRRGLLHPDPDGELGSYIAGVIDCSSIPYLIKSWRNGSNDLIHGKRQ